MLNWGLRTLVGLALLLWIAGCGTQGPCPDGAELTGDKPPKGTQQWCAKEDKAGNIVKHGRWTRWYENGKKAESGDYKNNQKEGRWTLWDEDGHKSIEGELHADKQEGLWVSWNAEGQKTVELNYVDGKENGLSRVWHPNGTKGAEHHFKNGVKHGKSTTWHENGQKLNEGEYSEGIEVGTWTVQNEDGTKAGETIYDGEGGSITRAYENGKVRAMVQKRGEQVLRGTMLDENGKPEEVKEFVDNQLAKIITYTDGVETGSEVFKAGRWTISATTSSMDDSAMIFIFAEALTPVQTWMDEEFLPKLVLRCQKGNTEVMIQTGGPSETELHGANYNTDRRTVSLRFDDTKPKRLLATAATSQKALFLPKPVNLIKQMLTTDSLLFQHTVLRGGSQTISFDLRQLDKVIPPLRRACGWSP